MSHSEAKNYNPTLPDLVDGLAEGTNSHDMETSVSLPINAENESSAQDSKESAWQWVKRQQLKLALGGVAISTALTVSTEFNETKEQVFEVAPWVGTSLAASEVVWIGGAAMMLAGVGSRVRNPLKLRGRMDEIAQKANDSKIFKTGFGINTTAAVGQAAILTEAIVANLPPESWGYLGIPLVDLSSTLVIRNKIWKGMKSRSVANLGESEVTQGSYSGEQDTSFSNENEEHLKAVVREAHEADIGRLADIDLARYKRVYGKNPPSKGEVAEMFSKRMSNAGPGWMYVCEVNGEIEGFITGFRTSQPMEEFKSWEDCTANGTLEGKVDPQGRYGYIANLTVNPKAMKSGGEYMLMARLMAQAIQDGLEYGYFVSRMPIFSAWIKRQKAQGRIGDSVTGVDLDNLAKEYASLTEHVDGKEIRADYELRMYEEAGFTMGPVVQDAFEDPQSLNYGVLFKVEIPPGNRLKKSKILRHGIANTLRLAAKNPKVLDRVFS